MARVYINTVCFKALLLQLCALSALGQDFHVIPETNDTGVDEYYYDYTTDIPAEDFDWSLDDWLYELMDVAGNCDPNPCLNGGSCDHAADGSFICLCPEPYSGKKCQADDCDPNPCLNGGSCDHAADGSFICLCPDLYSGKKCQTVTNVCKNVKCGRGSCVVTSTAPFYECKCKHPYKPPNCTKASRCRPNPCQNGGSCMKGPKRSSFQCSCPHGYSGKFCEVEPNDCYQEDGEFYRGMVSVTVEGEECLDWNSYFILQKGGADPITGYPGFDGIGPHNYCRNPDGDDQPWCYINNNGTLKWEYCKVRKCSGAPATPPTIHEIDPTPAKPDVPAAQFSQCGRPGRSVMIIRGLKSPPGANPWQVSLQTRSKGSSGPFNHMCGGILLESCWVLTAAHCIISEVEMQVVLGGVDLEKDEIYDQVIPVEKAIVHEDYKKTLNPFVLHNDIAMLQLKVMDRPYCAKETRYVKTACLPNQPFNSGTECVISGWGATEKTKFGTNKLLQAPVLLISQEKCKAPRVYGDSLDDSMLCAGYLRGGVDSCQGDSGGPLVCQRNGTHYVVGVVSWSKGCGLKNKPGVYANVGRFVDWITRHLLS
ncbi:hypothetical protein VZT92_011863 [Zoarces viviparus]|uniref:trypsin n=1 Tax=Zoarces viviparus TaxID=48416 RepID=A0AAW1F7K8_ZOAVI